MTIENQSQITYGYTLPDHSNCNKTLESNVVQTQVLSFEISAVKSSDKLYLEEGETAVQKIIITNETNAKLKDLFFKDQMSDGAEYVDGSVKINGTAHAHYDPKDGFNLPDIDEGESLTIEYEIKADSPRTQEEVTNKATITYKVENQTCCSQTFTKDTNAVSIELISTVMELVKSVDKHCALKGETLHYTTVIHNNGNVKKTYIFFQDEIPDGTTFVEGSVMIDGTPYPDYDPEEGFTLTDFAERQTITVTFDVTVD
jgi:uncharacterized repeat protein (TIGR01451 family)